MNEPVVSQENLDAVEDSSKPRRLSRIDEKRLQAHQERRRRLLNKGVPEDKVDMVMAQEDYNSMPVERKFDRLASMVEGSIKRLSSDLLALRHNDGVLADLMDSNYRAMARCLVKAGVSLEEQSVIIKAVNEELAVEHAQKLAEAKVRSEAQAAEAALKAAEAKEENPEGAAIPEEATVFGG